MKRFVFFFAIIMLLFFSATDSVAETTSFPAAITEIQNEAFRGSKFEKIVFPDGLLSIGDNAFADCPNLTEVWLPESIVHIGRGAFFGGKMPIWLHLQPDSIVLNDVLETGIDFEAVSTYRALLIGQSDYRTSQVLSAPPADVEAISHMISAFSLTPFHSRVLLNQTGEQILSAIGTTFREARPQDVSLFYYSGHGAYSSEKNDLGALVGVDEEKVNAAALRSCLDQIPGRKIVIVDACYSGNLIGKSILTDDSVEKFACDFLSAFSGLSTQGLNLATDNYYVITAAHSSQMSYELTTQDGVHFGIFTFALCKGCGYDEKEGVICPLYADTNQDHVITFQEAFQYARYTALSIYSKQTAQEWSQNGSMFGMFR